MEQSALDVDDIDEYRTRLVQYVNDGYASIMLEKYKPWIEENATVESGEIRFESLSRIPTFVLQVKQDDAALSALLREDKRIVSVPKAKDGTISIRFRYKPQRLKFDADEPRLPEWTHSALADWATWRLLGGGNSSKQQKAQHFRLSFEEVYRRIEPYVQDESVPKKFKNLYA